MAKTYTHKKAAALLMLLPIKIADNKYQTADDAPLHYLETMKDEEVLEQFPIGR